jgi:hypothetical protein
VVMEKVNLDFATDLHVFGTIEIVLGIRSDCIYVLYLFLCLCASLAPEQAAGYNLHLPFKNYPTTGECQADVYIPATKIRVLHRGAQTQNCYFLTKNLL